MTSPTRIARTRRWLLTMTLALVTLQILSGGSFAEGAIVTVGAENESLLHQMSSAETEMLPIDNPVRLRDLKGKGGKGKGGKGKGGVIGSTKAPLKSKSPKSAKKTKAPKDTKAPKKSKAPKETKAPKSSKSIRYLKGVGESTKAPKKTKAPKDSKAPKKTKAPKETKAPKQTKAPKSEGRKLSGGHLRLSNRRTA